MRGGVVADQVGYGKTAITLALIDAAPAPAAARAAASAASAGSDADGALAGGAIPTKATLIVVPAHLMRQWPAEIAKFLGGSKKVVVLKSMADLKNLTVEKVCAADIVLVTVTMLRGAKYFESLGALAAMGRMPNKIGRLWEECYLDAVEKLEGFVRTLGAASASGDAAARKAAVQARLREARETNARALTRSRSRSACAAPS